MDPITLGLLIGGGSGLLKGLLGGQQEEKDQALAATTMKYSPWTGMKPEPVKRSNMLDHLMQGAGAGLSIGQGVNRDELYKEYLDKSTDFNGGWGRMPPPPTEFDEPEFREKMGPPRLRRA